MKTQIVVVDDEKDIADLLTTFLANEGFSVATFYQGTPALEFIANQPVNLAVLDVMLPDIDGFTMLQKIRQDFLFPVLMLTAKGEDLDKITGLTLGADDYITKPFNPLEVVARVKTQLRRAQQYNLAATTEVPERKVYDHNGLYVDKDSRGVFLYEQPVKLTPIEFEILWYLCENAGRVVTSEELFENVWKEKYLDNNNTVMAHIARLREKMQEKPRQPKFVKTVWGVGYTLENE